MNQSQLIQLVVDKAVAHLEWDDAHPDVGMGMFISTAVSLAEQSVLKEAARWNSIEALRLDFDRIREVVTTEVRKKRENRA